MDALLNVVMNAGPWTLVLIVLLYILKESTITIVFPRDKENSTLADRSLFGVVSKGLTLAILYLRNRIRRR